VRIAFFQLGGRLLDGGGFEVEVVRGGQALQGTFLLGLVENEDVAVFRILSWTGIGVPAPLVSLAVDDLEQAILGNRCELRCPRAS